MRKVENGACPQIEGKVYNPVDADCGRCSVKGLRAVSTNPGSFFGVNGGLCGPLKETLWTKGILPDQKIFEIHAHFHSEIPTD